MRDGSAVPRIEPAERGQEVERRLLKLFDEAGWRAKAPGRRSPAQPDLKIRRAGRQYGVEVKVALEGRSDRLIPLWSQAYLELSRHADPGQRLVVVAAPRVSERAVEQLFEFVARNAPEAAAGVLDERGLARFRGEGLEGLDREPEWAPRSASRPSAQRGELFSDLNQWMLKVLLAPAVAERYLRAPRQRIRNASELSRVADVSAMSANRFVNQLREEGFLEDAPAGLRLVQRESLLERWRVESWRSPRELALRAPLRLPIRAEVRRRLRAGRSCLGLFAAAEAHHLGHVQGVAPHVLVRRLDEARREAWSDWLEVGAGDADVILREPSAPNAVLRGVVEADRLQACDILQVWLDVSRHPSRGSEQAALIYDKILRPMIRFADVPR